MARIKRVGFTQTFEQLSAAQRAVGDQNDCTVKAMVVLTGKPYAEVHAAFAAAGRKTGRGASFEVQKAAAAKLGFRLVRQPYKMINEIISQYPGAHSRLQSITTHHPRRFAKVWAKQPPMMFHVSGHVAAFKDGVLHDWSVNSARRVIDLWTVEAI